MKPTTASVAMATILLGAAGNSRSGNDRSKAAIRAADQPPKATDATPMHAAVAGSIPSTYR
jgi:hypothetical protein